MTEKGNYGTKALFLTTKDIGLMDNSASEYPFSLSAEDLLPLTNVKRAENLLVTMTSYPSDDSSVVKLVITGDITFSDGKKKKMETEEYLSFSEDPEITDVEFSKGKFDLMPALKALFYAGCPKMARPRETSIPQGDFTYMTVEDYRKKQQEKKEEGETYRPFADLAQKLKDREIEDKTEKEEKKPK